jgi:acyl transferase domain-containing protein
MNRILKDGMVIAIGVLVVTSIVQSLFVSNAYALTRYFNCVTRIANGNGTMSLENVKGCYYKVFQGARDADADGHKIKIK